jgi:uncharacterized protein (TIGR01570 family)
MGFAIYPAPGRGGNDDDARSRQHSSLPPSSRTTPAASTRTSSASSFDGAMVSSDDGHRHSPPPGHTLETPPSRKHSRWAGRHGSRPAAARLLQKLRTVLPALTLTPRCGGIQAPGSSTGEFGTAADSHLVTRLAPFSGAARPCRRVTGTLYGRRKGRVALALQETPRCLPDLVVELALQTHTLLRELGNPTGARIVLETQRRSADPAGGGNGRRRRGHGGPPLLDEPAWTMFCNGRKTGYAVRREATGNDLAVMETLRAVSMGAGVLPAAQGTTTTTDDEVPYMRGSFDHFVGSRDSESLYMIAPQGGGTGPELAVFFVRL